MKLCACGGLGCVVPEGERRRWAKPECFVAHGRRVSQGINSVLRIDSLGQEVWLR